MKMWLFFLFLCVVSVWAQEQDGCFWAGDVAGAAIGGFLGGLLLVVCYYYGRLWYLNRKNGKHLVLTTDPENAKNEFAFDNPGFKNDEAKWRHEAPTLPLGGTQAKPNGAQTKPTGALNPQFTTSNGTHPTRHVSKDDLSANKSRVRRVQLWARDFTGLGLRATGGARAGVLVHSVLRAGPAAAADIQPGDKIKSIKITLTGAVLEDAAQILSLASPYPVELEVESPTNPGGLSGYSKSVHHPLLKRAGSYGDVQNLEKELKHLRPTSPTTLRPRSPNTSNSNNSTLESKSIGGIKKIEKMITSTLERAKKDKKDSSLERENEKNARTHKNRYSDGTLLQKHAEATSARHSTGSEIHVAQNEPTTSDKFEKLEMQKRESDLRKGMRFGIKVLPPNVPDDGIISKSNEKLDRDVIDHRTNDFNSVTDLKVESEVKSKPVVARRRDKNAPPVPNVRNLNKMAESESPNDSVSETQVNVTFTRDDLNSSGIRRDEKGIPQEIPQHMFNAAMHARSNRKSSIDFVDEKENTLKEPEVKTPRKSKGKAPNPPENKTDDEYSTHLNNFIKNEKLHSSLLLDSSKDSFNTSTPRKTKGHPDESINFTQDDIDDIVSKPFKKESDSLNNYYEDSKSNLSSNVDGHSVISSNSDKGSTTIELNTSDVTVHSTQLNETLKSASDEASIIDENERKAASLGDLSRFEAAKGFIKKPSSGTLERAQSLDISADEIIEPGITPKKRKAHSVVDDQFYEGANGDVTRDSGRNILIKTKEPRLSLNIGATGAIEGLSTFQRNRLKKASEFGNLEDAIVKGSDSSLEKEDSNENLYTHREYDIAWNISDNDPNHETSDELAKRAIEENQKTNLKLMHDFVKSTSDGSNFSSINSTDDAIFSAQPVQSTFGTSLKYDEKLNLASDTNMPDDLKVSRHTLVNSLERPKSDMMKKLLAKNPIVKPQSIEQEEDETEYESNPQTDSEKKKVSHRPDVVNFNLKTFKPQVDDEFVSSIKIGNNNWIEPLDSNVVTIRTDNNKNNRGSNEFTTIDPYVKNIQIKDENKNKEPDLLETTTKTETRYVPTESYNIVSETNYETEQNKISMENIESGDKGTSHKNVTVNVAEDEYGNKIITKSYEQISSKYIAEDKTAPVQVEQISFGIIKNPSKAKKFEIEDTENLSDIDEKILDEIKNQHPDLHFIDDEPAYTKTETVILSTNLDEGDALALMDKLKNDPNFMTNEQLEKLGVKVIHDLEDKKIETDDLTQITKAKYTIDPSNLEVVAGEIEQDYITEIQVLTPKAEKTQHKVNQAKKTADFDAKHYFNTSLLDDFIENEKIHTSFTMKEPKIPEKSKEIIKKTDNLPRNTQIKFRTSTYESPKVELTSTDRRAAEIDSLRSTFDAPAFKPSVTTKPSNIPVKLPEKKDPKQSSPSKIPVFNRSHSQENLMEKSLSIPKTSPAKTPTPPTNVSVTSIKTGSKNPSGM